MSGPSQPPPGPAESTAHANPWHQLPVETVLSQLQVGASGLSPAEAAQRLTRHGPNTLKAGRLVRPLQILARQFKSLILWLLVGAGVVSGLLGEGIDSFAILAIVVLNTLIGFYQEYSAEKAIAALHQLTAPQANVWRDGALLTLPAAEVVPGDILALDAGDLVAADARLLTAASLQCVESALTGEAEAVTKQTEPLPAGDVALGDRTNLVFLGTSVATGAGRAVVVATAMNTELGRIAGLMQTAGGSGETPLQQKLESFGRLLIWTTLGIVALLFGLGWWRGTALLELFLTSVSLAVAAVPEGLPTMVTVALALGVRRMSRRRALVRRLAAVETLGSTTVICTDKTGTLTVGEMTVRALEVAGEQFEVTGEGYGPEGDVRLRGQKVTSADSPPLQELATVLRGGNHAHLLQQEGKWRVIGDPTEGALRTASLKAGVDTPDFEQQFPSQQDFPFDSDRKRSSILRRRPDGSLRLYINGAPGPLLAQCTQIHTAQGVTPLTADDRKRILARTSELARQALRVLASAYRDFGASPPDNPTAESMERELVFVGLAGMYDPPRAEAREAVARCRSAGVRVVMITGDHPETAASIAREIGLADTDSVVLAGDALERLSETELRERVPKTTVFARVTAEHKLRIVQAWQASGAVVAMTGDGVNDAPAIQGADIGIAMGRSGTEVTKQVADMIILDDNFATIVAAVEEGRGIYDNIRKTLQYLLAGNAGELLLMTLAVAGGFPAPLLPIHLLWINLVTDGLPALCLATDRIDPEVMQRPPRQRSERMTDHRFLLTLGITALLTAGVAFVVYVYVLNTGTLAEARTSAFAVLVFAELLRSFGARSETQPVWRIGLFTNLNLALVVAVSFGLQVWSQHNATLGRFLKTTNLSYSACLGLLAVGAIPLLVLEILKLIRRPARTRAPG